MGLAEIRQLKVKVQSIPRYNPRLLQSMDNFHPDLVLDIASGTEEGQPAINKIKGFLYINLETGVITEDFDAGSVVTAEKNLTNISKLATFLDLMVFTSIETDEEVKFDGGVFIGNNKFITNPPQPFPAYYQLEHGNCMKVSILSDREVIVRIDCECKDYELEAVGPFTLTLEMIKTGEYLQ